MNDLKKYLKTIRSLFPVYGHYEKRFFADLKNNIAEYVESCPNPSFSDLKQVFGTPASIISEYLSSVDTNYLAKQLSRARYIRTTCVFTIIAFFIALTICYAYTYKAYLEFQKALPAIEETTLEVSE